MSYKINLENLPNHYVNGEWVSPISNNQFNVQNPATETTIGNIFLGNSKDVDRAVQAAKDAFSAFSIYSKQERLSLLKSLKKVTNLERLLLVRRSQCQNQKKMLLILKV